MAVAKTPSHLYSDDKKGLTIIEPVSDFLWPLLSHPALQKQPS